MYGNKQENKTQIPGTRRHKINVRFESSILWRYFDVFYFELFSVSVYKHVCMHTYTYTHIYTDQCFKAHIFIIIRKARADLSYILYSSVLPIWHTEYLYKIRFEEKNPTGLE